MTIDGFSRLSRLSSIDKQHAWISKLQSTKIELQEWRRKGKRLLYSMMPRHIAQMLQQGVLPNSICEVRFSLKIQRRKEKKRISDVFF